MPSPPQPSRPASILVIDDDTDLTDGLQIRLSSAGYAVSTANSGDEGLAAASEQIPDAILLDVSMPGTDGLSVLNSLRADSWTQETPVVMLTADPSIETRRTAKRLGAAAFLQKPVDSEALLAALNGLLGRPVAAAGQPAAGEADGSDAQPAPTPDRPPLALIVDDDDDLAQTLAIRLRGVGVGVIVAHSGMEAFARALTDPPDIVITDYGMPGGNGEYLIARIKDTPGLQGVPVIVITAQRYEYGTDHALKRRLTGHLGATAFVEKPFDFAEIREIVERSLA